MSGEGRDIFTVAHELGHLFLHHNRSSYARGKQPDKIKVYANSEWQADQFAAELLMSFEVCIKCTTALEIQYIFGVSKSAAENRFNALKRGQK